MWIPLSTEECGHQYYDGDGVIKNIEEAYVWYQVAQCAGNHRVDSLVNCLNTKLMTSKRCKLSSRAKHIYARALRHSKKNKKHLNVVWALPRPRSTPKKNRHKKAQLKARLNRPKALNAKGFLCLSFLVFFHISKRDSDDSEKPLSRTNLIHKWTIQP